MTKWHSVAFFQICTPKITIIKKIFDKKLKKRNFFWRFRFFCLSLQVEGIWVGEIVPLTIVSKCVNKNRIINLNQ